ncbi:hypothetical protein BDW22DRAFT_852742 [Trametopsis cervina]|nr:hypothetical protein BDW22DRAFT_852742 [Trametopsis cervina]
MTYFHSARKLLYRLMRASLRSDCSVPSCVHLCSQGTTSDLIAPLRVYALPLDPSHRLPAAVLNMHRLLAHYMVPFLRHSDYRPGPSYKRQSTPSAPPSRPDYGALHGIALNNPAMLRCSATPVMSRFYRRFNHSSRCSNRHAVLATQPRLSGRTKLPHASSNAPILAHMPQCLLGIPHTVTLCAQPPMPLAHLSIRLVCSRVMQPTIAQLSPKTTCGPSFCLARPSG